MQWQLPARQSRDVYKRQETIGTLPLERGQQGVWSIYLPGDQHGRYYTYTVTVDGISRQTGDPYARAAGVNGTLSMICLLYTSSMRAVGYRPKMMWSALLTRSSKSWVLPLAI